jgi:hypothetical protein
VVWALNPAKIEGSREPESPVDPRMPGNFARHFLQGTRPFIWLGEPHTMNRRLIAQSATFVLPGVLDMPVEQIVSGNEEPENVIGKFILPQHVREPGMRELYRMNITYATLFPDLDGLARSMGYELEFHWAYNPRTLQRFSS